MLTNPKTAAYRWPTFPVDPAKLVECVALCRKAGVTYGLGAKAPSLSAPPSRFPKIDCSGFLRWALYQASGGQVIVTDGSVQQHEAIAAAGFKASTPSACVLKDGAVRVAFLPPRGEEPGHVAMFLNGESIESHGGVGPDRRPASSLGWLAKCAVYVLTAPEGA